MEKQQRFLRLIAQGVSNSEACRIVGIHRKTGTRWRYGRTVVNSAGELRALSRGEDHRAQGRVARGICRSTSGSRSPTGSRAVSRSARSRASWDARRRRSAGRSAATATPAGATARTGPSMPLERGCGARGCGGVATTRCWPAPSRGCWAALEPGAGRARAACLVRRSAQRWLCVESIYQAIYDPAVALTRPARRRRRRRRLAGLQRRGRLTAMTMIGERPEEVEDRVQLGHWEGDLIMGPSNRSAIGTLVERNTRFLILLAFPAAVPTADAVRHAITAAFASLPAGLRRTLTWDQGKELALHQQITARIGTRVFFCDAHAPWQRGSNENVNGLLRDYFPKRTDLSVHTAQEHPARRPRDQPAAPQDTRLEPTRRSLRTRARQRLTHRTRFHETASTRTTLSQRSPLIDR